MYISRTISEYIATLYSVIECNKLDHIQRTIRKVNTEIHDGFKHNNKTHLYWLKKNKNNILFKITLWHVKKQKLNL